MVGPRVEVVRARAELDPARCIVVEAERQVVRRSGEVLGQRVDTQGGVIGIARHRAVAAGQLSTLSKRNRITTYISADVDSINSEIARSDGLYP